MARVAACFVACFEPFMQIHRKLAMLSEHECMVWELRRVPEGLVDVVLSYCHHTLFDRTLEGLLPYLQGKGVGIINASVLSMGLLTPKARHLRPRVM